MLKYVLGKRKTHVMLGEWGEATQTTFAKSGFRAWVKIEWAYDGWSELASPTWDAAAAKASKDVWNSELGMQWRVLVASNYVCNALFAEHEDAATRRAVVRNSMKQNVSKLAVPLEPKLQELVRKEMDTP